MIQDINKIAQRVLSMVKNKTVSSIDGSSVKISPQTICVHGDASSAVATIKAIRDILQKQGIKVEAFSKCKNT